jgi:hypothetical protein
VDDPWWGETHAFLEKVADQLAVAVSGTLLGPMIWKPKTGQATMRHTLDPGQDHKALMERIGKIGGRVIIKIEYLEQIPLGK